MARIATMCAMLAEKTESKSVNAVIYEPTLEDGLASFSSEVIGDLEKFKKLCNVIVANRYDDSLLDVIYKVYTRDVFRSN